MKTKKIILELLPFALVAVAALFVSRYIMSIVFVHGPSMEPTLREGQIVLLNRLEKDCHPGDIVITNKDNPYHTMMIKRVVAVEGQQVCIQDGSLLVDGVQQEEPYLAQQKWDSLSMELVVPEGQVFLLGDNRNRSQDSRDIGCVPLAHILGTVRPQK